METVYHQVPRSSSAADDNTAAKSEVYAATRVSPPRPRLFARLRSAELHGSASTTTGRPAVPCRAVPCRPGRPRPPVARPRFPSRGYAARPIPKGPRGHQALAALRWLLLRPRLRACPRRVNAAPLPRCCNAVQVGTTQTPCFRPRDGIRAESARRPGKRGTRARSTADCDHVASLRVGRARRLQTSCKRVGLPVQTSCKPSIAETTRNRTKRLRRSREPSGVSPPFASLRRQLATSGRQDPVGFPEAVAQRRGVLSGGFKRVLGWLRTSGCVIVIRRC
jgi:hypothetical protein